VAAEGVGFHGLWGLHAGALVVADVGAAEQVLLGVGECAGLSRIVIVCSKLVWLRAVRLQGLASYGTVVDLRSRLRIVGFSMRLFPYE
jgi:hypothetical protein